MPDAPAPIARSRLRPEIQGLRAVAVLLVVLFHLWPGRLSGGYIGVDVFFVISGFLITGNLLREVETHGRIRLADFWARRARRLLPAAYLVLLTTGIGVLLVVPRMLWQQFFKEIGASSIYVENWSLAHDAVDYLAEGNAPSPVQHYWTLSAEEQFYLVWPLLILLGIGIAWLLGRLRWTGAPQQRDRVVLVVLGAAVAASLAYSLWVTRHNPAAAYFVTPARAWEFGFGALLANVQRRAPSGRGPVPAAASWSGLLAIVACGYVFDAHTPMPGTAAVVVVVASALVIAAGNPTARWSPGRLLTLRPVTFLGDISYSIYLWHWPLLILLGYAVGQPPGFWPRVGVLAATVLLAWVSKVYVEDPIRTTHRYGMRRPAVALLTAGLSAALVVATCGAVWQRVEDQARHAQALEQAMVQDAPPCFGAAAMDPAARGCPNPDLADTMVPSVDAVADDWFRAPGCSRKMHLDPVQPCQFGDVHDRSVPHIAVIGDSHARALMPPMVRLAERHLLSIDFFTAGGCAWTDEPSRLGAQRLRDSCNHLREDLGARLRRHPRAYDFVVTTAWAAIMDGSRQHRVRSLVRAWAPLAAHGVPVVAVRDNPTPGPNAAHDPNLCIARVGIARANAECSLSRARHLRWDPFREAVRRTPHAREINMIGFYCRGGTCPVVIGGVDVYRDNSHVTTTYARTMAPYYYRALRRAGLLTGS
ncbi:MAG TPA: acyltransferase family protein [Marmoricola sp.]|nr:acyltransferase family protein [Marmoricola sp.]